MAIFPDDTIRRDGIQLGGPDTLCYKCELERMARDRDSDIPYGDLQYKEVFKVQRNGLESCLCMRHFNEMIAQSHYMLIDTNEAMAVPLTALEEPEPEPEVEVEAPVEEAPQEEVPVEEDKPKKKGNGKKKEDK